jgi:predicted RNase H-like HicB family nuclease
MAGTGIKQIDFQVEIIVEPDGDEYHSYCPALKGLHACGETVDEALSNARDAATAYIESLIKHGDPIPVGVAIDIPLADLKQHGKGKPSSRSFKEDLTVATA